MIDFFDGPAWEQPYVAEEGLSGWIWKPGLRNVEFVTGVDRLSDGCLALPPKGDDEGPIYTRRQLFATQGDAMRALLDRHDRSIARRTALRNSLARKLEAAEPNGGEA
jgi:hypothetical protein